MGPPCGGALWPWGSEQSQIQLRVFIPLAQCCNPKVALGLLLASCSTI